MENPPSSNRRHIQRRWRERRHAAHPVFMDTRTPHERRTRERREGADREHDRPLR